MGLRLGAFTRVYSYMWGKHSVLSLVAIVTDGVKFGDVSHGIVSYWDNSWGCISWIKLLMVHTFGPVSLGYR